MRYKWLHIASFLFCLALLFCGCQAAPKEVQERMEDYGKNQQMESGDLGYCTIEELREAKISDAGSELDNMVLPKSVDFSGIEGISTLSLSMEEGYREKSQADMLELFGIAENSLESEDEIYATHLAVLNDPSRMEYLGIQDNGLFSYLSGVTYDYIMNGAYRQKGILVEYDTDVDDISGKTVTLDGEETLLTDMVGQAESWINQHMAAGGLEYRIINAYIRELGGKGGSRNQLSLSAEAAYQGMRLNAYVSSVLTGMNIEIECYSVDLNYDGKGQLSFYCNGIGSLKVDAAEEVGQVVDFPSAVRLVNEKVSGFHEMNITKIIPIYVLYPQESPDVESYGDPGQKMEGRPAYAFLIRDGQDDSPLGMVKSNIYQAVLVDMVTGAVRTVLK